MPSSVLLVVSAATEVPLTDGTRVPAGYLPLEVANICEVLAEAGHEIRSATPGGVRPSAYPDSRPEWVDEAERGAGLREPSALSEIEDATGYAALVIPGGHGAMVDLPGDPTLGRLLLQAREAGVPIAAVGHGAAGLLSADRSIEQPWPFAGVRMTASSDAEQGPLAGRLAYSVETALREEGAVVEVGEPFTPHVVVDGLLVTGQNLASAVPAAQVLLGLIDGRS